MSEWDRSDLRPHPGRLTNGWYTLTVLYTVLRIGLAQLVELLKFWGARSIFVGPAAKLPSRLVQPVNRSGQEIR